MLLAIDIGNSNTVIGLFQGEELLQHWRLHTNRQCTADEIVVALHTLFAIAGRHLEGLRGVIVASVVPQMHTSWLAVATKMVTRPIFVDHQTVTWLRILTDNPAEVGVDRVVNAVAGLHRYRQDLIIVDFGTAITFDCVSSQGDFLGGAIVPGMGISIEALASRTAKLPRIDIVGPPPPVIATNTVTAIQSGVLYGYGGLVEGLIGRLKERFAPSCPRVVATGGMARLIAPYAPSLEVIDQQLTLEGLRLIHERCRV